MEKRDEVLYEKEGGVARIILNRPEKLNAFDFPGIGLGGIADQFQEACRKADLDDDVKAVIIKGSGRAFCVGRDLEKVGFVYGMGTGKEGEVRPGQHARLKVDKKAWFEEPLLQLTHSKITIAQVHGYCLGKGMEIMEQCDMAFAAEDAVFGHTEQRLNSPFGNNSTQLLILMIGLRRAMELLTTGRKFTGKEAAEMGLINRAVPADKLDEVVTKFAEGVAFYPADGIAIAKASRLLIYESMGVFAGYFQHYIMHTMMTQVKYQPDEWIFLKERRDKGAKAAFHKRDMLFDEKFGLTPPPPPKA